MTGDRGVSGGSAHASSRVVSEDVEHAAARSVGLVVLPLRRDEDGHGVYPDTTTFLVKDLRAEGVEAAFLDEAANRFFLVQNSALDLLTEIAVGVASGAAWDALKWLLSRRASEAPLTMTYVDLAPGGQRREFTATGESRAVLDAIDRMREGGQSLDDGS